MIDLSAFQIPDAISIIVFCIYAFYLSYLQSRNGYFFFCFFLVLALLHFVTTIIYIPNGKDAIQYFTIPYNLNSTSQDPIFGQGAYFIHFFTYFLIRFLHLSYTGCYFAYSIFGLTAYYIIINTIIYLIKKYDLYYKKQFFYILLLPGLHYWTVALGKDSIMFFSIALFFSGLIRTNMVWTGIGGFIIGVIRSPALLLFVTGIIAGKIMMNKKVNLIKKTLIVAAGVVLIIFLMPLVQARLGKLESLDYEGVNDYISYRLTLMQGRGSYVDMSNASPPVKFFSFLVRPFFYDAKDLRTLASSFENVVWLCMLVFVFINLKKKMTYTRYGVIYSMLFFSFIIAATAHSTTLTNLGIAVRMKTMYFIPLYILVFLSYDFKIRQMVEKNKVKEFIRHKKLEMAHHTSL